MEEAGKGAGIGDTIADLPLDAALLLEGGHLPSLAVLLLLGGIGERIPETGEEIPEIAEMIPEIAEMTEGLEEEGEVGEKRGEMIADPLPQIAEMTGAVRSRTPIRNFINREIPTSNNVLNRITFIPFSALASHLTELSY